MDELFNRVKNVIKENVLIDDEKEITLKDEFFGDLGFDSVKFMGLFYSLEDEFDVSIINSTENYKFYSIVTVEDLVEVLTTIV